MLTVRYRNDEKLLELETVIRRVLSGYERETGARVHSVSIERSLDAETIVDVDIDAVRHED